MIFFQTNDCGNAHTVVSVPRLADWDMQLYKERVDPTPPPMLTAFDPMSLAVAASVVEHSARARPQRIVPRAKAFVRRNSKAMISSLVQEASDPLLDALNTVDPRLAVIVVLLMLMRFLIYIAFDMPWGDWSIDPM